MATARQHSLIPSHDSQHGPIKVSTCKDTDLLKVQWLKEGNRGEKIQSYPYVWLRDNCRCELCFHDGVHAPIADVGAIDLDVHPISIEINHDGDGDTELIVQWSDDHRSKYSVDWLAQFKFHESDVDTTLDPNVKYWGADVGETQLKFFEFGDLLNDDKVLCDWMVQLQELGLTVIRMAPRETGQLNKLGKRVSFLRPLNYGPTFQVKTKTDASNIAYTSERILLHTDSVYYIWPPGVQLLHCIDQVTGTGGGNGLSDGFKAAEQLQREDPEAYKILTSTPLEFFNIGTDHFGQFHQYSRHPVIRLDDSGKVKYITWSDYGRAPMLRIPQSEVKPLYRAMKAFSKILYDPNNLFKYKMNNGDILCFNNRRTLHGRDAFTLTETNSRHLEGGYLDWDEINSKLRVLKQNLSL